MLSQLCKSLFTFANTSQERHEAFKSQAYAQCDIASSLLVNKSLEVKRVCLSVRFCRELGMGEGR